VVSWDQKWNESQSWRSGRGTEQDDKEVLAIISDLAIIRKERSLSEGSELDAGVYRKPENVSKIRHPHRGCFKIVLTSSWFT